MFNFPDALNNIGSGLISSWFFEEQGGSDANDTFGPNDLFETGLTTINSALGIPGGFVGSGRHFKGGPERDAFSLGDGTEVGLDGPDFIEGQTILAWVNLDNLDDDGIFITKGISSTDDAYRLGWNTTNDTFLYQVWDEVGGSNPFVRSDTFKAVRGITPSGEWHMVCAWWDKATNTINIEVNASGVDTEFFSAANLQDNNKPVYVGALNPSTELGVLNGRMAYLAVWNRPLTSEERRAMYNGGLGLQIPFTTFLVINDGTPKLGGWMRSVTPTNATPSGIVGGYLFAARQLGPSGTPNGILPRVGGFTYSLNTFPTPNPSIGGHLFSKPRIDQRNNQFIGGYTKAPGFQIERRVGGFVLAQPLQNAPTSFIGGAASGALQFGPEEESAGTPRIGGWIFGRPDSQQHAEQHSRTLVKARSEDVVDQGLNIDNQLILFQRDSANFWGRVQTEATDFEQFHGRLAVQSFRERPTSDVSVNAITDASGVTEVEVCASGIPGETGTFFTFGEIDFGEPYRTLAGPSGTTTPGGVAFPTVSGSISGFDFFQLNPQPPGASGTWQMKAKHVYENVGEYIITTKFVDNLGMVHMRGFALDLLGEGSIESLPTEPTKAVDFPGVGISGVPRLGNVPPSLLVDFDMAASGLPSEKLFPERDAVVTKFNKDNPGTNNFVQWNFGNGAVTTDKRPFTYYQNPGFYVPVFRYQFKHPSGTLIDPSGRVISPSGGPPGGSGAILGPQYGPKSIWLSESLLIGFNT